MNLRVYLTQLLVTCIEAIFFYPKLKKFYKSEIKESNPLIIDVGSNRGQSIDFFKEVFKDPLIHGFEPNPNLFNLLQEKYGSNKHITLMNVGVSEENTTLNFYENIMDETSTLELLNEDSEYLQKKARVLGINKSDMIKKVYPIPVVKLGGYLKSQNISKVDLVKIDTEGHEYLCLKGLFDQQLECEISYIQIEQHYHDMYASGGNSKLIQDLLNQNSFTEVRRIGHGFGNFHDIIYKNNLKSN